MQQNKGLPAGAEVYQIAIASSGALFAATSLGVYESDDGAGTWKLAGLEGIETRAVIAIPASPFSVMAATTDSTLVYLRP